MREYADDIYQSVSPAVSRAAISRLAQRQMVLATCFTSCISTAGASRAWLFPGIAVPPTTLTDIATARHRGYGRAVGEAGAWYKTERRNTRTSSSRQSSIVTSSALVSPFPLEHLLTKAAAQGAVGKQGRLAGIST